MLCRFLLFLLGHLEDAEDVTQETLRIAVAKGPDPAKGTDYGAWLRSIARNVARNFVRRQRKSALLLQGDLAELAEARFVEAGADRDDVWEQRREALASCVQKLSSDDRGLIRRRYEALEQVREIAQELAVPPNSLSKRLERIRESLRRCINAALNGERRE